MVPVGEHALLLSPFEFLLQPPHLRRALEAPFDEAIHGVENHDAPLPEVVRVPTFFGLTGSLAEVVEVRSRIVGRTVLVLVALLTVVVVSYGRVGDVLETPPGWLVALVELCLSSALVGVVPEGEDGVGLYSFGECDRSLCTISSTLSDISRPDENVSLFVRFRWGGRIEGKKYRYHQEKHGQELYLKPHCSPNIRTSSHFGLTYQ